MSNNLPHSVCLVAHLPVWSLATLCLCILYCRDKNVTTPHMMSSVPVPLSSLERLSMLVCARWLGTARIVVTMRSQIFVPDAQLHEIMTGVPVTATVCPLHFPDPRILAFLLSMFGNSCCSNQQRNTRLYKPHTRIGRPLIDYACLRALLAS
jgi:hypothetical protein